MRGCSLWWSFAFIPILLRVCHFINPNKHSTQNNDWTIDWQASLPKNEQLLQEHYNHLELCHNSHIHIICTGPQTDPLSNPTPPRPEHRKHQTSKESFIILHSFAADCRCWIKQINVFSFWSPRCKIQNSSSKKSLTAHLLDRNYLWEDLILPNHYKGQKLPLKHQTPWQVFYEMLAPSSVVRTGVNQMLESPYPLMPPHKPAWDTKIYPVNFFLRVIRLLDNIRKGS